MDLAADTDTDLDGQEPLQPRPQHQCGGPWRRDTDSLIGSYGERVLLTCVHGVGRWCQIVGDGLVSYVAPPWEGRAWNLPRPVVRSSGVPHSASGCPPPTGKCLVCGSDLADRRTDTLYCQPECRLVGRKRRRNDRARAAREAAGSNASVTPAAKMAATGA
jgi:hypothetical protein